MLKPLPSHASCFVTVLRLKVMSEGSRFGTLMRSPPTRKFSPAASRYEFSMCHGPGPFHPAMACVSCPTWKMLRSDRS